MNVSGPLTGISPVASPVHPTKAGMSKGGVSFSELVTDQVRSSNESQATADKAIQDLVTGQASNVEDTVMSIVKADLSFRMLLEIRNRVMEAYQEIMRMQV